MDDRDFTLKQISCSLLKNGDCNEIYTPHNDWSSSYVEGAVKLDIKGLLPYTMYSFTFNGTFSVNFSVSTDAAAPEGFGEDKIHVTSTLTTLTVNWEEPAMLNGPLTQVNISITPSTSKKRRSADQGFGMLLTSNEVSGNVLFNNLTISTVYIVQVTVINRYDAILLIPLTSCVY